MELQLSNLKLKTFTGQNAVDYCLLNNINSNDITELDLGFNELTDISGIKIFKNVIILWLNRNKIKDISVLNNLRKLKQLYLWKNEIKDISVIQYLNNLELLDIDNLELESDQINYIKSLKNFKELKCNKGFKDMDITDKLNENIEINDYLIYK